MQFQHLAPSPKIFTHLDESLWTSKYFRATFLYPSLRRQQTNNDSYLRPFTDPPGHSNSLEAKFWSIHCFCQGARTHVSRSGRVGTYRFKRATTEQIYEHGRWRYL